VTFNDPKQMGWVLDLGSGTGGLGWRVVTDSTAFNGAVAFASTLPSGDACNPSGSSRIYSIDFGTGKSVLTATTTDRGGATTTVPIVYSTATTSVVTDLRFFSVDGQARLIGGSDTGDLKSIQGNFTGSTGLRRLNWRELPTPE
jgi:type IV pilus assembly protein PilY1